MGMDQGMAEARDGHDNAVPSGADPEGGRTVRSPSSPGSPADDAVADVPDCREHPGIVIRPGPTGRRAALFDGPDVWEVIAALHALHDEDPARRGESLRTQLCSVTGLTVVQVSAALDYYTAHPDAVDQRIADNIEAALQAQQRPAAGEPGPPS
jgi:hypothetical protein